MNDKYIKTKAMKAAKELTQELINKPRAEKTIDHMEGLKPEINNMLHTYLPDDLTIREVDVLAMVINEMVWNPKSFLIP